MELIDQHTKRIMEGCKERARDAGLACDDESLEYIVTNRDLIQLSPKLMIPTLYDYWVHDVQVLQERGRYELYPSNPYETVINTRPAISFYNDNNPDWLNVMIFYHVLAHIDFFQSNQLFRHTWNDDFAGQALSDKLLIAKLRSDKGRWVDYVIEFARGIDNLVDFYGTLARLDRPPSDRANTKLDYYFDIFLQRERRTTTHEYMQEVERYNRTREEVAALPEESFFAEVNKRFPEFEARFRKHQTGYQPPSPDLLAFLCDHSPFIAREDNRWMRSVLQVVRSTSLFFQPQIRTKIMNEGWASYWHERLFLADDRIRGNEVGFARIHAKVTSLSRVGLNPYALGMRLFAYVEEMADRGALSAGYDRLRDAAARRDWDAATGSGLATLFALRADLDDFLFLTRFVDQDFVDRHRLFVAERQLNEQRMVWEYTILSRKAEDYKQMVVDGLYHPPAIAIAADGDRGGELRLVHRFEGKPLVQEYIANTLLGIEYLWGAPVALDTHDVGEVRDDGKDVSFVPVRYTMSERQLSREEL